METYRVSRGRELVVVEGGSREEVEAQVEVLKHEGWWCVGGEIVGYPHGGWWDEGEDERVVYIQNMERVYRQ